MTVEKQYPILYEAYEHYLKTGDRHFDMLPENNDYVNAIINTVLSVREKGFIENLSDNLLNLCENVPHVFPLGTYPPEKMSFDITSAGIRLFEEARRKG